MMKVHLLYLTLSFAQSAYISRMQTVNRLRAPTPFRPGVMMRPWAPPRLVAAGSNMASHRAPYVFYRNTPQRYAMKHYPPGTRTLFTNAPWKTTGRLPTMSAVTPEYEFIRAASAQPAIHTDGDTGAIHTIPAPNLSLSEKPIVVIDSGSSDNTNHNAASEQSKPVYEETEKYPEQQVYQMAKIETPVSFSKVNHLSSPELQSLVRNGVALQFAPEYGLQGISLPQASVMPQQFAVQGINRIPSHEDLINAGAESIVIPPNALYQPDPLFLQKLQSQLLQRFPAVEFIPYAAEAPQAPPTQSQPTTQQIILFNNDQITKQSPSAFAPSESKNIVQRATQESSVTVVPKNVFESNATEKAQVTTQSQPNTTYELLTAESEPVTTTVKYVVERNTEEQHNTTPIYYAQIGQSVGDVIANGFYSAINDVRAAATLAQMDKPEDMNGRIEKVDSGKENVSSSTLNPDLQPYFVQKLEKDERNQTVKPLLGAPFAKPDSVKVAYTLLRTEDKDPKVTKEGNVYAGQIVEATISEDRDFNNEQATLLSKRPPIRIFAFPEKQDLLPAASSVMPRVSVKAKIPAKSKLTFDDKTGEPVLRIYASYDENPSQKEAITNKLSNLRFVKDAVTRRETVDNWKSATIKSVQKTQGFDANQVPQFGLKLKSRSDDFIPLFDEYDD